MASAIELRGSVCPRLSLIPRQIVILSGGQTGLDRAALDAALELGFRCGGTCPAGRKAADGRIPDRHPLTELASASYPARTRRHEEDADGTLIIHFGPLTGGTALTPTPAN